jgi:hypothetical protein
MQNKSKAVYEGIWKITVKFAPRISVVKDKQGNQFPEPKAIRNRWKDYFDELYNDPNPTDPAVLREFPLSPNLLPLPPTGTDEVEHALRKMKRSKAPGVDNITAKQITAATQGWGLHALHQLCQAAWEQEALPAEWKQAIIVSIH